MTHPFKSDDPKRDFCRGMYLFLSLLLCGTGPALCAQDSTNETLASKVEQLTEAMSKAQRQLEASQREIQQLREQLNDLRQQLGQTHSAESSLSDVSQLAAAVEQIREQQSLEETQVSTHEQAKVESESKYPVKISGLVLLTGLVNTTRTDDPVSPTLVLGGPGSSGASIRQTVLGFDARGPHVFGAATSADLRVDFYGASASNTVGSNAYAGGLIRLRTAHAAVAWSRTQAFFSLDHPLVSPNTPSSLTAVAVPALAWSGNLWTWNPQLGVTQDFSLSPSGRLQLQAALINAADPPQIYNPVLSAPGVVAPTTAELSRWPGAEGRLGILRDSPGSGLQLGAGGVFVPHRTPGGTRFNSWAGTVDYRIPLPGRTELSGAGYLGQALGGLGGGGYKDYVYNYDPITGYVFRTLHDFGGWTQLKERASERLELNFAFGTDQVPAAQLRPFAGNASAYYLNLARNRTYTANVIYSPSAYLMFSLEYRRLFSSPVNEYTSSGNIIGIATGYRF